MWLTYVEKEGVAWNGGDWGRERRGEYSGWGERRVVEIRKRGGRGGGVFGISKNSREI